MKDLIYTIQLPYSVPNEFNKDSILIGFDQLNSPIFLNFEELLNNNIAIVGSSGSGKTFFIKNFILRAISTSNIKFLIYDTTGEYTGLMDFEQVIYTREKEYLQEVFTKAKSSDHDIFLFVLDEAWRVLLNDTSFSSFIREGRKYKIGFVLSTQSIDDFSNEILENISLFLLFSSNKEAKALGSCELIEKRKDNIKFHKKIKILGLQAKNKFIFGDHMKIDIPTSKFYKLMQKDFGEIYDIEDNEIELAKLINILLNKSSKQRVLKFILDLGIDKQIAVLLFSKIIEGELIEI